jgi:hypothetical protein
MRCPECSHNQRYRNGMVCGRCRYRFVLNPKVAPFCADGRFVRGIELVSFGRSRSYTATQLHGAIFRRRNRGFLRRLFPAAGSASVDATVRAVGEWRDAGRDLGPIIVTPRLTARSDPVPWPEPDLYDYGAEGVLVVDAPILVDLLVDNQVHMTSRVAIVDGSTAAPAWVVDAILPLVAARPDLPIFLLHGSGSGSGEALAQQARETLGAAANPVIDIGLAVDAPKQMKALRWARGIRDIPVDLLPHSWLTAGVAAAIANQASFVEVLHRSREDDDGWIPADGDGDFG